MTNQPGNPLTQSLTNPNHVTLIMTTEFAFNGSGTSYSAAAPLPLRLEAAVRIEIQNQLRKLPRTSNPRPCILFLMSCAIDTGMVVNGGVHDGKTIGWNRIAIISSLTDDVQYVYKLQVPPAGDDIVYDGWDFQKYVVSDGWSYFDPLNPTNPRRDTEGRLAEATYNISLGVGSVVSFGFGTCLDSTLESYPGTNCIAFCGGGTELRHIRDTFFASFGDPTSPVVWHLGYLINDAVDWISGRPVSEWLYDRIGYEEWTGLTWGTRIAEPEENVYNMIYQIPGLSGLLSKRYLSVSEVQSIPPLPASVPQTIGTMYLNLSPAVLTRLQTIVDLVLGSVPGSATPYSVMDILRVYNARPRDGSAPSIPEVDAILTQCMVKILVPPKPVRTR